MKINLIVVTIIYCFAFIHQSDAQIKIEEGSGSFNFLGGIGHENDTIKVHYHKPKNFIADSKVLLVIPGAGRNADDYRDSWVEASEKHNILIISPSYSEQQYDFGDYHLGGIVKDLDLRTGIRMEKGTNKVYIDESIKRFSLQPDSKRWLYHDFDRLFDLVISSTGSSQKQYDIFGHSTGGQILHRFALLFPDSKANRILASNSGSYTLPNSDTAFPFGVSNLDLNPSQLKKAFKKNLVIFLGELDNENETGGLILRSPTVDKQGTHRLARGKYFHSYSKTYAKKINSTFNWDLFIVPNVGHNQKLMAKAASQYLYE
jgi:pimeloyl-ACP methyl ester carboxylesterase